MIEVLVSFSATNRLLVVVKEGDVCQGIKGVIPSKKDPKFEDFKKDFSRMLTQAWKVFFLTPEDKVKALLYIKDYADETDLIEIKNNGKVVFPERVSFKDKEHLDLFLLGVSLLWDKRTENSVRRILTEGDEGKGRKDES